MTFKSQYVAKKPNAAGLIEYTATENAMWATLYARQMDIIKNRACDEYVHGLQLLNLPTDRIPQCPEVSAALTKATGWKVTPVPALISNTDFFELLANRIFPAASFIRHPEEIDYLKEPDIFHEIFGHCPLLTDPVYANFMEQYGQLGIKVDQKTQDYLTRLYWFTVEFGLINTSKGLRIYGGGILSSTGETVYATDSPIPERKPFNALDVLRTSYRYDIMQPLYFVINHFDDLYGLLQTDLLALVNAAQGLGDFPPAYPPIEVKPTEKDHTAC